MVSIFLATLLVCGLLSYMLWLSHKKDESKDQDSNGPIVNTEQADFSTPAEPAPAVEPIVEQPEPFHASLETKSVEKPKTPATKKQPKKDVVEQPKKRQYKKKPKKA